MTCQPSKCMSRDCRVCECMCVSEWSVSFSLCPGSRAWKHTHADVISCLLRSVQCWRMCAGREPHHYLNGSHFLACRHFSEAAISAQTDRVVTEVVAAVGVCWGGLKVMSCLTLRTDDFCCSSKMHRCPRGKITIVFTWGHFCLCDVLWLSQMMEVNNLHRR